MDMLKQISPLWVVIAFLVVVILILLFRQRRSGYTPSTGAPISLMDLQEFSVFTPVQKTQYMAKLANSTNELSQAAASKSIDAFQNILRSIIIQVMNPQPPTMMPQPPQQPMMPQPPQQPMMPQPPQQPM